MAAIQQTLPLLTGGVSQGTDSQVSPANLRVCDNFIPDLVWGLAKRPGSDLVSTVAGSGTGSYFNVKLGDQDDYLVHVGTNGNVAVSDALSGERYTVNQQASSYLSHKGQGTIEVLQLGDFVFILNRDKEVKKASVTSPSRMQHGWASVRSLSYETTYRITISASGAPTATLEFTTAASGSLNIRTVVTGLQASAAPGIPWTINQTGNTVGVRWTDQTDTRPIFIQAVGGFSGDAIEGYSGRVSSVSELPATFFTDRPVLVKPVNSPGPGYWVTFTGAGTESAGTWSETLQRDEQFRINPNTMPHVLVRRGNGAWVVRPLNGDNPLPPTIDTDGVVDSVSPTGPFNGKYWLGQSFAVRNGTGRGLRLRVVAIDNNSHPTVIEPIRPGFGFSAGDEVKALNGDVFTVDSVSTVTYNNPSYANLRWTDRSVGSQESIPWPSFIDRRITGIGFYLNRLVLLSEDNVIASKAGDYLNFFPTTAIQVLADDPVDINTGETVRTILRHAVDYNGQLICVAEDKQYSLRGGDDGFTPISAKLGVSSRVKASTILKPLSSQINWLLVSENNSGVQLVEMYPNADDDPNLSRPVSASIQVPTYVPRGVFTAAIEEDLGFVAMTSKQQPGSVYLWRWVDQSRQRLMASWFRMTLPLDIEHLYFSDNFLHAVGVANGIRVLCRVPMSVSDPSGRIEFDGYSFNPRLDLMDFTLDVTYNSITDQTTIPVVGTIYDTPSNLPRVMILSGPNQYVLYEPEYSSGNLILPGNIGTTDAVIGYRFQAEALLPHIYLRGEGGTGVTANVPKVRRLTVRSFRSGGFGASITVPSRPTFTKDCGQAVPNQYNLGQLIMQRIAEVTVPTMCDGDDMEFRIIASCPLPVHIQEVTWKGTYTTKGLRSQ